MKVPTQDILKYLLFFISSAILFFILYYNQTHPILGYRTDTLEHIDGIELYFNGLLQIAHPLWHISVHYTSTIFSIPLELGAAFVTTFFTLIWVILVTLSLRYFTSLNIYLTFFVSTIIIFIGPLYFPFVNYYIIHGQGSPNLWHNVTLTTLKPFALLTFVLTLYAMKIQKITIYISATLCFILSIFAKPSFSIVFIPSLILLIFYKPTLHNKRNFTFIILLTITFLCLLFYQYLSAFDHENTIKISFLEAWSMKSHTIPLSIFSSLAFPFFLLGLAPKILQDDKILLSWLMIIISLILALTFIEVGARRNHGNFMWSYMISLSILYFFSIVYYVNHYSTVKLFKKFILNFILGYQFLVGLYYFSLVYRGYNPIYI